MRILGKLFITISITMVFLITMLVYEYSIWTLKIQTEELEYEIRTMSEELVMHKEANRSLNHHNEMLNDILENR